MFSPDLPLRIGTRGSPLALTQAASVAAAITRAHDLAEDATVIVPVRTTGDRVQDRPLSDLGGKALWTRELDRALVRGEVDIAVHSMKDVETIRPAEIAIAAILPRADVRERLIGAESLDLLPPAARIGTSSPRREAQLRRLRPDLSIVLFRGNVDTRLAKLAAGEASATLLAAAGLDRLGRPHVGAPIPIETMLPAPAQGAVGVEALAARADLLAFLGTIDHADTRAAVETERAFLARLGATCRSPVAALARVDGDRIRLSGELLLGDGSEHVCGTAEGPLADRCALAATLAARLLGEASPALAALFAGP